MTGRVWQLKQDNDKIYYKTLSGTSKVESNEEADLKDYFQLSVDLTPLYKCWADNDPVFEKVSHSYSGVRMLRQDPVENLFAFICSSNNNIQRISGMVS